MNNPYKLVVKKYTSHNFIVNNIGQNKVVLDVGCNDGYIGAISDKSNIFYGLDYLKDSIQKTKKAYKDAFIYDLNTLAKLPWNIMFDVLIFGDVLEHLHFPEKTLAFLTTQYLKKNGKVILSLPNISNWRIRTSLLFGNFNYTDSGLLDRTHLHFYTFRTARDLVRSANLRIIKEYGSSMTFGAIIKYLPITKNLLTYNIILICKKKAL